MRRGSGNVRYPHSDFDSSETQSRQSPGSASSIHRFTLGTSGRRPPRIVVISCIYSHSVSTTDLLPKPTSNLVLWGGLGRGEEQRSPLVTEFLPRPNQVMLKQLVATHIQALELTIPGL